MAIDLRKLLSKPVPKLDFCLPGLLAGTVGSIVSPGGLGKSMLALELCSIVAGGADLLGIGNIPKGKAVYLPVEDPQQAIEHRLFALFEHQNEIQRENIYKNLIVEPLEKYMPDLLDNSWIEAIMRLAENTRLIVLDTLTLFHTADENDNGEMKRVIATLIQIASKTGCTILFVHHTAKGSEGRSATSGRGASVLRENIRWQSYLSRLDEKEAKAKDIDEEQAKWYLWFGINKVNFGEEKEMLLKKHLPTNKEINAVVLKKYSEQKNGYNVVYEDANIKNEALDITIETRNPNRKEAKKRVSDLQKGGFNFG
jgi:RecA-family ATPase